jgi:predicted transcriptional regulator
MTVRNISIEAYEKHHASGRALTQWQKLYVYLSTCSHPKTRAEISATTGIRLSSVCGRVKEMMQAGLLEEFPRRRCAITDEPAHPVGLAEVQLQLFREMEGRNERQKSNHS